jgi:hypothetical protein
LIIDMISDFQFEDGAAVKPVSILFVNDNMGHWRSDFRQMLTRCRARNCRGAAIIEALQPTASDYFVAKPTHAATMLRMEYPATFILSACAASMPDP